MRKILTVLGARPQFIKASVLSSQLEQCNGIEEVVVHTGQHFDQNMSDVFFQELGMSAPRYQLGIQGGSHGEMTGKMLIAIEKVIGQEQPDILLVYGDTNSTLAGALAASKLHVPIAHVEAGLRSFNSKMPEEINRVLTDKLSTWLFTPTAVATRNLEAEGVARIGIHEVGDVMYDVALHYGAMVGPDGRSMEALGLHPKGYILATIHRAESTNFVGRLEKIVDALNTVAQDILPVLWPLHPRTRNILQQTELLARLDRNVRLIDPVGYLDMVQLEKYASVIVTDSGGVQKEAFFHQVPCITLRDETEWVELVDGGWNTLVSPDKASDLKGKVEHALNSMPKQIHPYGNGDAAKRIVETLAIELAC